MNVVQEEGEAPGMPKNNVAEFRVNRGLSVQELAWSAQLDAGTIRRVEKGTSCSIRTARRIVADGLGLDWGEHREQVFPNGW